MATDFNSKTQETTRQLDRSHGSFELALAPVILGLLGLWIDSRLGTTPLLVILLTVFGFAGAGTKLFFSYRYEMAQHDERRAAGRASVAERAGVARRTASAGEGSVAS